LWWAAPLAVVLFGCPSFSTMQTARTLDKGKFRFGVGLGMIRASRAVPEDGGEALGGGANAPLDQLAPSPRIQIWLFLLVDVDANMVHGWLPLLRH
jgi:hypothetical protein